MKTTINVYTQNMRNHISLQKGIYHGVNTNLNFKDVITRHQIDIAGLQEMTVDRNEALQEALESSYQFISGNSRLPEFCLKIPFGKLCCEYNPILCSNRFEVLNQKTYLLPFFKDLRHQLFTRRPALMPRIANVVLLKDKTDETTIVVMNTHIDYNSAKVKALQLNYLIHILQGINSSYPMIIMGDFNLEPQNIVLQNFFEQLQLMGFQATYSPSATWINYNNSKRNGIYDHIFYKNFENKDFQLIDYRESLQTDHKGLVLSLQKR